MKRSLAGLLAVALLSGQVLVPSAHELDVARVEAGHHFCSGAGDKLAPADSHAHHDEADCRLCLGFSGARAPLSPALSAAALPQSRAEPCSGAAASASLPSSSSPRGPPASRA